MRQGQPPRRLADAYIGLSKDPAIWSADLSCALDHVTRFCVEATGVTRASVWRMSADRSAMQCLSLYEVGQTERDPAILDLIAVPDYYNTLGDERLVEVSNAFRDPRLAGMQDYLRTRDIHSFLDATVRVEGETRGVLCFESVGHRRMWSGEEKNFLTSVADLISQLFAVAALRDSEQRYRALFDGAADAIFVMRDGLFIACNPAASAMFGCSGEQLLGMAPAAASPPWQPCGGDSAALAAEKMRRAFKAPQRFEWQHRRMDGSLFDAEVALRGLSIDGRPCLLAVVRDITERKRSEAILQQSRRELEHRATHDDLTGLPNRSHLHARASEWIERARIEGTGVVLMLLDLDRFKEVNDTLGHRVGDLLLKSIANDLARLLAQHRAELFRLGGDEFVILAYGIDEPEAAMLLGDWLLRGLREPRQVESIVLELGGSLGIALFPREGGSSHDLLRCADVAMYHAKVNGLGAAVYESGYDSYSPRRLALVSELGNAIRADQLQLYFQPRVGLDGAGCTGCEALLRWPHPQLGMVPPGDFIPAAEMSDIIHALGRWVIRQALRHVRRWLDAGRPICVAVNLSARNLLDAQCPAMIAALLREFSVPAGLLEIEITESALITDPERALKVLLAFRDLGLRIAIDDFGTGYSSLSYLKKLPIDTLKVDRSFVSDMLTDPADEVIVRSTIGLAHSFGLIVVAEGVEDAETLAALAALGCDQAQGFHIARPMPAGDFERWLMDASAVEPHG
ncbi:putative bifunctional diguanylate cyclase/phosphodiesterase [Pseudoxanthomonas mexicana]|uniref:putative bifunctional diguanylate cyclase/phosphodiesterase n=1 Tax=Pseudoxanthomonas mexicana TaxID=128785 RepID=UPI00398B71E3